MYVWVGSVTLESWAHRLHFYSLTECWVDTMKILALHEICMLIGHYCSRTWTLSISDGELSIAPSPLECWVDTIAPRRGHCCSQMWTRYIDYCELSIPPSPWNVEWTLLLPDVDTIHRLLWVVDSLLPPGMLSGHCCSQMWTRSIGYGELSIPPSPWNVEWTLLIPDADSVHQLCWDDCITAWQNDTHICTMDSSGSALNLKILHCFSGLLIITWHSRAHVHTCA